MIKHALFSIFFLFCLGAVLTPPVAAQSTQGTIVGTVRDANGATVPNASVVVTNEGTTAVRTVTANEAGDYSVTNLEPGKYSVAVESAGFKRFRRDGITLQTSQVARIDLLLEAGNVSETVTVTADAPLINTEGPALGSVKDSAEIQTLTLGFRDIRDVLRTLPGAQPVGSDYVINGSLPSGNNIMVDGGTYMNAFGSTFASGLGQPSLEALKELKVEATNNSASSAQSAAISMTTKTGTDSFHGSLFEYYDSEKLQARNFFSSTRLRSKGNQFGGSVGGPIVKKSTFFFFDIERSIRRQANNRNLTLPTEAYRTGDFSSFKGTIMDPQTGRAFPGNIIPANRISPVSAALQKIFPATTGPGIVDPVTGLVSQNYRKDLIREIDRTQWGFRIDQNLFGKDTLYGRFTKFSQPAQLLPANYEPFFTLFNFTHYHLVINYTHVFSPSLVGEFKAAYNHQLGSNEQAKNDFFGLAQGVIKGLTDVRGTQPVPQININGFDSNAGSDEKVDRLQRTYEWSANLTNNRGRHSLKGGVFVRNTALTQDNLLGAGAFNFDGRYTFSATLPKPNAQNVLAPHAYAAFLLGLPFTATQRGVRAPGQFRGNSLHLYINDDFKASSRLTLNLGVRYELNLPFYEINNGIARFDAATGKLVLPGSSLPAAVNPASLALVQNIIGFADSLGIPSRSLIDTDKNNIGPRVGFAYRVFGDSSTVVRGGFGVYFNVPPGFLLPNMMNNSPFGASSQSFGEGAGRPPVTNLADPFTTVGSAPQGVSVNGHDRKVPNATSTQWNISVERALPWSTALRVSYIGNKGTNIPYNRDLNQIIPFRLIPPGGTINSNRPFPSLGSIGGIAAGANSLFNSMQIEFTKRYSQGLRFQSTYTWAKHLTETVGFDGTFGFGLENSYDLRRDRSNAPTTPHQRFVSSFIYDLPMGRTHKFAESSLLHAIVGGWQLGGILTFQSGLFFSPSINYARDFTNTNRFSGRPDRRCDGNLPSGDRTMDVWFDKTCFVDPSANPAVGVTDLRYGNSAPNILVGPGFQQIDASLSKGFRITEGIAFKFRTTASNLLNHANFNNPSGNISSAAVGRITSAGAPRSVQLSGRIEF
jgi:hypothetical protein